MKIKNFFKKWRDAERNATYLGQALGLLSLYFCYKITEVIVIILFAIILGDGHYIEYGMLAGFIVGFHVYYKILIKYTKIKKTGNE